MEVTAAPRGSRGPHGCCPVIGAKSLGPHRGLLQVSSVYGQACAHPRELHTKDVSDLLSHDTVRALGHSECKG